MSVFSKRKTGIFHFVFEKKRYRYDESDHIGGCKNCHDSIGDCAAENFARCRGLSATGRTIHGCRQCLSAGCCRYRKRPEPAYRYGRIKQNLLPYISRAVFHSDKTVRLLTLYRNKIHKTILTHHVKYDILCHKSHCSCGLVTSHPQDVVVFILSTATESGWLSP